VLIFIGIAGSAFDQDVQQEMNVGQTLTIGPYSIQCQNFDMVANNNYRSERATLEVFKDGRSEMMLFPERRFFMASEVTETIVADQSTPLRDLYLVYAGRSPETNRPVIHAYLKPLVKWIWFGGIVLVLGTGLAMMPNRRTALVLRPVSEPSWADGVSPEASPAGTPARAPIGATIRREGDD
jgi:cytochrome c-type biogenesis protein CcmF